VVGARLEEEDRVKQTLARLEAIGVEHPDFDPGLRQLAREVQAHADREEREELPRLVQVESQIRWQHSVGRLSPS
jgi:hypothetical protein